MKTKNIQQSFNFSKFQTFGPGIFLPNAVAIVANSCSSKGKVFCNTNWTLNCYILSCRQTDQYVKTYLMINNTNVNWISAVL